MIVASKKFSILITTKNRINDLKFTLFKIQYLLDRNDVECLICDDGSTDGTFKYIQDNFSKIQLIQNPANKGLIFSRNRLLNMVNSEYSIIIDDDAHFLSQNNLENIEDYFSKNTQCAVLGFRIFWGLVEPVQTFSCELPHRMKSFVGCAHVWRMSAWREVPNYPEWFIFYGEEDFASYQLFKKNWEIHYLPEVFVHHRVDIKARKNNADYSLRLRRSLRSGWYLFFMFCPIKKIPRKMAYSLYTQFKLKVFKGDWKALQAIVFALLDLVCNILKIRKNSNRLTTEEYVALNKLPETKLYWISQTD